DAVRDGVLGVLGDEDVLGAYAPGSFEVLVLDVDAAEAERLARRLATAAARHGAVLRTGVAVYPRDGTSAHALLGHALDDIAPAAPDRTDRSDRSARAGRARADAPADT